MDIKLNEIIDFLCNAKKNTYAGKKAEDEPSRLNSHDLTYQNNDYLYLDTYLGGEQFVGEEGIWIKGQPFWAMNYMGRVLKAEFNGDFLKNALLAVPREYPFRGPKHFVEGDFEYRLKYEGDFEWFVGTEVICFKGQEVYECYFHGGLIK